LIAEQIREKEMMRKNESMLQVKKLRIAEVLKKDNNIKLRNKKLKEYTDAEIPFIEIEDLINCDKEIEQKEKDKKKQ